MASPGKYSEENTIRYPHFNKKFLIIQNQIQTNNDIVKEKQQIKISTGDNNVYGYSLW